MAVTLYRQVGKGEARRYQKVNLGSGRRPTNLSGPHDLVFPNSEGKPEGHFLREGWR